jgi:hypothetical protein
VEGHCDGGNKLSSSLEDLKCLLSLQMALFNIFTEANEVVPTRTATTHRINQKHLCYLDTACSEI